LKGTRGALAPHFHLKALGNRKRLGSYLGGDPRVALGGGGGFVGRGFLIPNRVLSGGGKTSRDWPAIPRLMKKN